MEKMIDHGRVLVHDITGKPRNYLHEVSIPRDPNPELPTRSSVRRRYSLRRQGYSYARGWRDAQNQPRDVWSREERL